MADATPRRRPSQAVVVAVLAALLTTLAGCGSVAVPAGPPSASPSPSGSRDPSGLLIVPPENLRVLPPPIPAALDPAFAVASNLSYENPADFGAAVVEGDHVLLPATSDKSRAFAAAPDADARVAALVAYDDDVRAHFPAHPSPPDLLSKRSTLDAPHLELFRLHVQVVPGGRSRQEADALRDETMDFASAPKFRQADVWEAGYDWQLGMAVITMSRLTPELADALVAKYGTTSVAVQIDANPHTGF